MAPNWSQTQAFISFFHVQLCIHVPILADQPYSPEINPLDYDFSGHLESRVCQNPNSGRSQKTLLGNAEKLTRENQLHNIWWVGKWIFWTNHKLLTILWVCIILNSIISPIKLSLDKRSIFTLSKNGHIFYEALCK